MRPTIRIARLTTVLAGSAVLFAVLAAVNPRGWLVSAFAVSPQQNSQRVSPLSFDVQFPAAALGKPYMQSMRASGGAGGYIFAEGGTPPPGMQWVPAGEGLLLRGTPTQAGDYAIRIIVNDSLGQQITRDATFHVTPYDTAATVPVTVTETITTTDTESITSATPITISPATIPSGQAGSVYAGATFTATGGLGTPTLTSTSTIPTGMTFTQGSAKLVLSGSPISGGTFPLTITATDSAGNAVSKGYSLVIAAAPPIVFTPTSIPSAQLYVPYAGAMITASGGVSPITVSSSSTLSTGLSFIQNSGSSVVISGTPQQTGTYPVTVLAIDAAGNQATNTYSLAVGPAPALSVYPTTITGSIAVGNVYPNVTFQGAGGTGSSTVALVGGSVPPGMTFSNIGQNSGAVLFGTPTKTGSYSFTVTATDTNTHATASQTYTINVTMPQYTLSPGSFVTATSGTPYSQSFSILGNPAGYTLTMTNAAGLPAGLTYTASGETVTVAGTPSYVSAFTSYGPFSFNLTDTYGNVETLGPVGIGVEPAPVATITLTTTPSAPVYTDLVTLNYAATGNYTSAPTGILTTTLDGGGPLFSTLANGTATLNFGTLAAGTHTVTYNYSGDSVYPGTGGTVPGQPANGTVAVRFTVAYPPYYLTGTTYLLPVIGDYDAIDAYDNVYIANTGKSTISKYDTSGNTTAVPTTGLNQPRGMVFDGGGNLYIADSGNNRIVELAPSGTQTVLPMGTYTLSDPSALAIDATYQNLWIVDQNNGRVLDYNLANQAIVTGNTVTGFSNNPVSVAVAKNGVVYAGSRDSGVPGGFYSFTPGSAQPNQFTNLPFSGGVYSMAFDRNGTLYVFAADNLYRLDAYGVATQVASSLNDNTEMAINSQGTVLLTAQSYGDLAAFTPGPAANAGLSISSEGYTGNPPGGGFTLYFHAPSGTTLTSLAVPANSVYKSPGMITASDSFASVGMARGPNYPGLQRSSLTATFSDGTTLKVPLYGNAYNTELGISPGVISQTATNTINSSTNFGGITIDQNGNVYFIDTVAKQVYEVFQGIVTPIPFTGLNTPAQVAVDGNGDVYVLDSGTSRILKYNNTATQQTNTTTVVFDLSRQNALSSLTAFALDGATDVYIAGRGSNGQPNVSGYGQIERQSAFGGSTIFSTGLSMAPTALAVDGNATVYSGDGTGQLVQYNHIGTPTTLATAPGPITSLAIEASGTVYATTSGSAVLTVVSPQGVVSSHSIAGVTQAVAVAEDGAGTLTVADGATGKLFAEVRDADLLYTSANANAGTAENLNFPSTVVGSSSPVQSYTLTNTGTTEDAYGFYGLYLTSLPNRTDFPLDSSTTCTISTDLAAGTSCVLAYTFRPASTGYDSEGDNISYSTTHLNNSYSTTTYPTFTGTGISAQPVANVAPGSLPFGSVGVGTTSASQSVTLTNGGGAALNISSIALSGSTAYAQTNTCGATLASLASCTVNVTFTPGTIGAVIGTLTITDNSNGSAGSTQTVSLTGTGIAAAPYVFVVNAAGSVTSLFSNGAVQSSAVSGGGIGAAVDRNGLVFSITADGTGVSTFSDSGMLVNTTSGVLKGASALAIDGGDQLWIAAPGSVSMGQILGSGTASYADSTLQKPSGVAIDISGNVWIADSQSNTVHEIVGGGLPAQPLANAVTKKTPGTEPQ